ncbi:hypothetical protein C8R47DRAFT_1080287 [Mycena vitilis]|nr:hypothetical protein C8R47DRAFT_1080287 [Mycena vitilis]
MSAPMSAPFFLRANEMVTIESYQAQYDKDPRLTFKATDEYHNFRAFSQSSSELEYTYEICTTAGREIGTISLDPEGISISTKLTDADTNLEVMHHVVVQIRRRVVALLRGHRHENRLGLRESKEHGLQWIPMIEPRIKPNETPPSIVAHWMVVFGGRIIVTIAPVSYNQNSKSPIEVGWCRKPVFDDNRFRNLLVCCAFATLLYPKHSTSQMKFFVDGAPASTEVQWIRGPVDGKSIVTLETKQEERDRHSLWYTASNKSQPWKLIGQICRHKNEDDYISLSITPDKGSKLKFSPFRLESPRLRFSLTYDGNDHIQYTLIAHFGLGLFWSWIIVDHLGIVGTVYYETSAAEGENLVFVEPALVISSMADNADVLLSLEEEEHTYYQEGGGKARQRKISPAWL